MESYRQYQCERCGDCCRHVNLVDAMKNFDRGDGVCKYLTAYNLCSIYARRPPLCNGEYLYKNFYSDMTIEEFHQMMSELCKDVRRWELEGLYKEI